MRFAELSRFLPRIEAALRDAYAREIRRRPRAFRPYLRALEEYTLRGGKRFRALLVLAGFHLATGRSPLPAIPAAAAFEQFQTWMLVHDDVIDSSATRRGGPTMHRWFAEELRGRGGQGPADGYGMGMAITVGDLAEPFVIEALLDTPVPAERRLAALAEYVAMTRETAYGQALDIRNGTLPIEAVREADVLAVHRYKTSAYTVSSPLRVGALLGGARPGLLADLRSIGLDLGVAFQLRDDVLGAGFDAGASGKSANDLEEGKRTLLVVRAWATADPAGRAAITAVLGHREATAPELEAARAVIRDSGSLAYSERRIRALEGRARRAILGSRSLDAEDRALLGEIGERLVQRTS